MSLTIAEFAVADQRDVAWAARRARLLASLANLPQRRRTSFGKATAALAGELIQQADRGAVTFGLAADGEQLSIEAVFRCELPEDAATPAPATADLQGWVDTCTESVDGRVVVRHISLALPPQTPRPSELLLAEWGTVLATRTSQSALATSQARIRNLAERLEETHRQGIDLRQELSQVRSLNETLELLALVASKTDNAVIILDAAGLIEWVNDGFVRITGRELSDVRGVLLPEFFRHTPGAERAVDALQEALSAGHGMVREIQHTRLDGEIYWASLNVTPVFNEAGTITRWIGIANDVTERHRYEEQLLQAKEAAESANRTKSEFLANISHEIRTPMNAIIGMTELSLDTTLSPEQRLYLRTVRQSAESLLALLNDLLDLSKIEAGRLAIDPVPLRLREALDEILRPHALQAARRELEFKTTVEPHVPAAVMADPLRLRQIVTNLVANSLKFTDQGTVEVYVGTDWKTDAEVGLQFHVRDTGIGIPAEKLATIFDSFTQAHRTTARHYGGTGLGLAICKELTDLMGGRLWVESEVGRGSTFYFTLRMKLASAEDATSLEKSTAPRLSASPRRPLRILVADDNPANRILATRILEKRGHDISPASNGQEVLAAVAAHNFDVVLLDVQMPDMDGFACTRRIREAEAGSARHLPIVAVTAYAMKGDRNRCLAAGMDDYLSKPIRAERLLALVEALAEGIAVGAEVESTVPQPATGHNFANALDRLEGDVEMFQEHVEYFLQDAPALLQRIRAAIDIGNAHDLHIAAHRIKGLAAGFDAEAVQQAALELEEAGRRGELPETPAALTRLVEGLDALRSGLQDYLEQARGA